MNKKIQLYYVHDPMCSWCWGFSETYQKLLNQLSPAIQVIRLLGGLAPDCDEPMPERTKQRVLKSWRTIEKNIPGKKFNFDFWTKNTPRRSTYYACRAVIAARAQASRYDEIMTTAIQNAYYQEAQNPSDLAILSTLAVAIGLDKQPFEQAIQSAQTEKMLMDEINYAKHIGADSFPSLILSVHDSHWPIPIDYQNAKPMLETIDDLLN